MRTKILLSISLLSFSSLLTAASSPAVAWSSGVMRVNGADHSGSANLPLGSKLETLKSAGHLYLPGGARLRLAAATRISVQPSHLQLDSGAARIDAISAASPKLNLQAGELSISTRGATIERPQSNRLLVTSASQSTEIRNSSGTLIAMVRPGQTLAFAVSSQPSASVESKITGCVTADNNRYYITDETTNVRTEIEGAKVAQLKGMRVTAQGRLIPTPAGAASKLSVQEFKELDSKCSLSPVAVGTAASTPAAATGSSSAATGSSSAATGSGSAATGSGSAATTATTVATAAGVSKTTVILITVASVAAGGASLGVIASGEENISQ